MFCIVSMQSPRKIELRSWFVVNVMASSCLLRLMPRQKAGRRSRRRTAWGTVNTGAKRRERADRCAPGAVRQMSAAKTTAQRGDAVA
jgi:hypothetical protein